MSTIALDYHLKPLQKYLKKDGVTEVCSRSASQSLQQSGQIAPTLEVKQGKPIMVFVARDVGFGALGKFESRVRVF